MDHDGLLELISAEADGELAPEASARLAEHLATCGDCALLMSQVEADRRRARIRSATGASDLVPAIVEARDGDRRDAARARTVLVRRGAATVGAVAAAIVALALVTASRPATIAPLAPRDQADALIAAHDHSFDRADIEVRPGTTVEWRNAGTRDHHLVRDLGGVTIDEDLPPGRTETATFERPGTFAYYCTIHPEMAGTVTVDA
jgi:plastocyanin